MSGDGAADLRKPLLASAREYDRRLKLHEESKDSLKKQQDKFMGSKTKVSGLCPNGADSGAAANPPPPAGLPLQP